MSNLLCKLNIHNWCPLETEDSIVAWPKTRTVEIGKKCKRCGHKAFYREVDLLEACIKSKGQAQ